MNLRLIIFAGAGILAVFTAMLRSKLYKIVPFKMGISAALIIMCGFLGLRFYGYLETGSWSGMRILGSILIIPPALWLISKLMRIPYWKLMDVHGSNVYIMLAIMKLDCLRAGCCGGISLWYDSSYNTVCFPSAMVECVISFGIWGLLLWLQRNIKLRGKLCGIGLIIYCTVRIPLEMLRAEQLRYSWGGYSTYTGCAIGILMGIVICWCMHKYHPNPEM